MAALCARAGRPWPSPGTNSPQDCLCPGSAWTGRLSSALLGRARKLSGSETASPEFDAAGGTAPPPGQGPASIGPGPHDAGRARRTRRQQGGPGHASDQAVQAVKRPSAPTSRATPARRRTAPTTRQRCAMAGATVHASRAAARPAAATPPRCSAVPAAAGQRRSPHQSAAAGRLAIIGSMARAAAAARPVASSTVRSAGAGRWLRGSCGTGGGAARQQSGGAAQKTATLRPAVQAALKPCSRSLPWAACTLALNETIIRSSTPS